MILKPLCFHSLYVFLAYISTFVIHKCDGLYPTMTFDQKNHALINLRNRIGKGVEELNAFIALACPAQNREERTFNLKTFGKNSLFVKDIYEAPVTLKNVYYERCETPFKMSVCYQKSPSEFLFGYEIYVEHTHFPNIRVNNYSNYDYVANAFSSKFSLIKTQKATLELAKDRPLSFIWILMFRMIFDHKRTRPRQVIYTVSKSAETGITCKDYELGKEIYEAKKINLEWFYENQSQIFHGAIMPKFLNQYQKPACERVDQCLTKGSLIPPEEFRFRYPESRSISCSDATTVPIWKSIVQGILRKVDLFLYALSKTIHDDLEVTAGVHGKLELPKNPVHQTTKTIKLGKYGQISAPNVIYKIVKCEVSIRDMDCENNCFKTVTKAIIIVISNDPYFDPVNAFCNVQNCEIWGWNQILYEQDPSTGSPSKYVFCCYRNEETLKNLGLKLEGDKSRLLDLTHFPMHDAKTGNFEYENIEQKVVEKMEILLANNDTADNNVDERTATGVNNFFYASEDDDDKFETALEAGEILSRSTSSGDSEGETDDFADIPLPHLSFFHSKEESTEQDKHKWVIADEEPRNEK